MVVFVHAAFVAHWSGPNDGLIRFQREFSTGVLLFFVLSGFVISFPWIRALLNDRPLPAVAPYLLRRGARLLPAYWLSLIGAFLLVGSAAVTDWTAMLTHVFMVHDLVPHEAYTVGPPYWTLGVEVQFYALIPLLGVAIRRFHKRQITAHSMLRWLLIAWAASVGWTLVVTQFGPALIAALHGGNYVANGEPLSDTVLLLLPSKFMLFCPGVAIGVLAADPGRKSLPLSQIPGVILGPVVVVGWVLIGMMSELPASPVVTVGHDLLMSLVFGAALLLGLREWSREHRLVQWLAGLGTVSYGIYLWHWIASLRMDGLGLLRPASPFLAVLQWLVIAAILLALSLVFAVASWIFLERRCIARAHDLGARMDKREPDVPVHLGTTVRALRVGGGTQQHSDEGVGGREPPYRAAPRRPCKRIRSPGHLLFHGASHGCSDIICPHRRRPHDL